LNETTFPYSELSEIPATWMKQSPLNKSSARTVRPHETKRPITLSPAGVKALVDERTLFHRFLVRRIGNATDAEDILQDSLLKALERGGELRRGERILPWFYRILRNAVADHFRRNASDCRKTEGLLNELGTHRRFETTDESWENAVCRCFEGLLPALKPRYAELIRRIDLLSEPKSTVAADLGISVATMNVTLHRARQSLRRRLEIFCGACSREHCLACACGETRRRSARKKL
jgi:RNA polymerase sigma factor (sigma-70 family)